MVVKNKTKKQKQEVKPGSFKIILNNRFIKNLLGYSVFILLFLVVSVYSIPVIPGESASLMASKSVFAV